MSRELLTAAARAAAARCGIDFYTGPEYRIITDTGQLPAIWLITPSMIGSKGINEGIRTYAAEMIVMAKSRGEVGQNAEQCWDELELTAHELCRTIADDERVKCITDVSFEPGDSDRTNRGERSITIKMNVQIPFRNPKTDNTCE